MKEVTMTKKYTIRIGWALFLTSLISTYGVAQESVDVPQLLQKNVHAFKLTIDSLESITTDIKLHTKDVIQDLKAIQKKMYLLPKDSRTYRLQYTEYEKKLSEYWARKHAMLWEMQNLRARTLASLQIIIDNILSKAPKTDTELLRRVQENIRKNDDAISQIG